MTEQLKLAKDGGFVRDGDPGEPSTHKPRVSIAPEEAKILAAFAFDQTVLEIGTGLGVSTRALASTAACVYTADIDDWVKRTVWPELMESDEGSWICFLDDVTELDPWVDVTVVFIDGDHDTTAVKKDIAFATNLLFERGGVILVHDCNYENVQDALDDSWTLLPTTHGIAIKVVLP